MLSGGWTATLAGVSLSVSVGQSRAFFRLQLEAWGPLGTRQTGASPGQGQCSEGPLRETPGPALHPPKQGVQVSSRVEPGPDLAEAHQAFQQGL